MNAADRPDYQLSGVETVKPDSVVTSCHCIIYLCLTAIACFLYVFINNLKQQLLHLYLQLLIFMHWYFWAQLFSTKWALIEHTLTHINGEFYRNLPSSSSRWVARYTCLSFWSCFSIFLLASLCVFSSFRWSSVLLLPRQPIFPKTQW